MIGHALTGPLPTHEAASFSSASRIRVSSVILASTTALLSRAFCDCRHSWFLAAYEGTSSLRARSHPETEFVRPTDEGQALNGVGIVQPIAACRPLRFRQKFPAFVIADRLDAQPRLLGKRAD